VGVLVAANAAFAFLVIRYAGGVDCKPRAAAAPIEPRHLSFAIASDSVYEQPA